MDHVKGNGGSLLTFDSQTFAMAGSDTLGFSIVGENGKAGNKIQKYIKMSEL